MPRGLGIQPRNGGLAKAMTRGGLAAIGLGGKRRAGR
jgi:hypothetical protein